MAIKRLLIVDDSEIDRTSLKNILRSDFDIVEADNSYAGLQIILSGRPHIDGVLLDLVMPVIDGFTVLRLMKEKEIENLPVILVTANATKPNVEKAMFYKVTDFITKPYNAQLILNRLRPMFNIEKQQKIVLPRHVLSDNELTEIRTYETRLKKIASVYFKNNNIDEKHYARTSALTEILLNEYSAADKNSGLDSEHIAIISEAAYFMDMGLMAVPDNIVQSKSINMGNSVYQSHAAAGADIVRLNQSPSCAYFAKVCSDICIHHHERFDGKGFPHELSGSENSMYVQICAAAEKFDTLFSARREVNDIQYSHVLKEMQKDAGEFGPQVMSYLEDCQYAIISYYKKALKK